MRWTASSSAAQPQCLVDWSSLPPAPPKPPPHQRWVPPKWMRPDNYVGRPLPMQRMLARSSQAAILMRHLVVYPTGFEVRVECFILQPPADLEDLMGFEGLPYYTKKSPDRSRLPEGLFRFGIRFSDSSKVTTVQDYFVQAQREPEPDHPMMIPVGSGSHGPRKLSSGFWIWPLPPPGPMFLVCEWPALGISFTRQELDSAAIREAAMKSVPIWSD